jgi:hypothetical protein
VDELLIMAFLRMLGEKPRTIVRMQNGYCGDHSPNCDICQTRPWWAVDFENVGIIVIGWRKRVIHIDWHGTNCELNPFDITTDDVTKDRTYIHAYGYGKALIYLDSILCLIRLMKRGEVLEKQKEASNQ